MAEETKPTKTKRAVKVTVDAAKIVMAISALVAAYNGYRDLESKNALVLEALGSKLNALAEKVSYLEGRLEAKVETAAPSHPTVRPGVIARLPEPTEPVDAPKAAEPSAAVTLQAYTDVPLNVQALQQLQVEQLELKGPPGE